MQHAVTEHRDFRMLEADYVKSGGTLATIQAAIREGKVTPNSLVWRQGMANWVAASNVPEINALFGAAPPPLPG